MTIVSSKLKRFVSGLSLMTFVGCGYHSITTPEAGGGSTTTSDKVILKVVGEPTTIDVNEGSTVVLIFSQSSSRKKSTLLDVSVEGVSSEITDVFGASLPVQMTIPVGSSSGSVSIPTTHNARYTGNRSFTLKISSNDSDVSVNGSSITLRIVDQESAPVISMASTSQNINEGTSSGTVTVSMTPASNSAVQVAYSFTAGTASLSDFSGTNGTLTFAAGETSKTIPFTITGDTSTETLESFSVSLGSVTGTASVSSSAASHTVNIIDDDQASLSIDNVTANEGSALSFTVNVSVSSPNTITVQWASQNGTATAGTHYTSGSGTLTFAPGETSKTVNVNTTANASEVCASNRTLSIVLSSPTNASIAVGTGTGTIVDPDRPTISIAAASAAEGSSVSMTVSLSQACSSSDVGFSWATSAGTASAGTDYASASSTGTITAGSTSTTVSVSSIQDTDVESNETFTVTLSSLSHATAGTLTATGTITDNDFPNITIADLSVLENAGTASVTVTLSQSAPYAVAVDWATVNGTALSGTHYTAGSGTLTIPAGQTSGSISVTLTNNSSCASDTSFTVGLSNPTQSAVISDASATVTIQNDDYPTLTATGVTVGEGFMASIPLTLSTTCGSAVVVSYSVADVTTTSGSDYYSPSTSITIPAGVTSYYLPISTTQDFTVESTETFNVNFTGATNATVSTSQVTVSVTDDDATLAASTLVTHAQTGSTETCAVMNGGVYCWGLNYNGEVGDGTTLPKNYPIAVSGLSTGVTRVEVSRGSISIVNATNNFACALKSGAVYCWGSDNGGALGNGSGAGNSTTPTVISSLNTSVTDLSLGATHACAIKSGTVYCWGKNGSGQVGDGTTTDAQSPVSVSLPTTATAVSASYNHSCALLSNGTIKCWGSNANGRLGDNSTNNSNTPVFVSGIDGTTNVASAITTGTNHSCAIVNGGVQCWGANGAGQLGDGTTAQKLVPTAISSLTSGVSKIGAGGSTLNNSQHSTCAILSTGAVKCWGNGTTSPASVTELSSGVTHITTSDVAKCAVKSGSLQCWGQSMWGQLGNGLSEIKYSPSDVVGLPNSVSTLSMAHKSGCAVTSAGALYCWGMNNTGQLGLGDTTDRASATQVLSSGVSKVSVSGDDTTTARSACAVMTDQTLKCWGNNANSQLGDGGTTQRTSPVTASVLGATPVSDVAASKTFTCVIVAGASAGTVKCWGANSKGQLGNNTNSASTTPVDVSGITSATKIVATSDHVCAIDGGALKCWGDNTLGQLGVGDNTVRWIPTAVTGMGSGVTSVDVIGGTGADGHTCAIKDGAAYCWGNGANGRLGNSGTSNQNSPAAVTSLTSGYSQIAVRHKGGCAINSVGGVVCWGGNQLGELGLNTAPTTASYSTAQAVVGLTSGALQLDGGTFAMCARTQGLGVKCWGFNEGGASGNNLLPYLSAPTDVLFP